MANHEIDKEYSEELRKIETTDPVHADTLNPLYSQLINNDAYLEEKVTAHQTMIEDIEEKIYYRTDHDVLPTDLYNHFETGITISIPNVATSDNAYLLWVEEISSVLGLDNVTNYPFRIVIKTVKRLKRYVMQKVEVFANTGSGSGILGSKLFTLYRTIPFGGDTEEWDAWCVDQAIIRGFGSPEGSIYGYYGSLYLDIENNNLYIKKGPRENLAYNTNWEILE